jgi:hypothetical protein
MTIDPPERAAARTVALRTGSLRSERMSGERPRRWHALSVGEGLMDAA